MRRRGFDTKAALLVVAVAACFIGYGAWRDMHPSHRPMSVDGINVLYLVDSAEDIKNLPDDNRAILVDLTGQHPPEPVNLPQREIALLIPLSDATAVTESVGRELKDWKAENNLVIDFFFDLRNKEVDVPALDALLEKVRADFKSEYYFSTAINSSLLEGKPETKSGFANLLKHGRNFIFEADEAIKPGETLSAAIKRLDANRLPFMLLTHEKINTHHLTKELGEVNYFSGIIIDPPQRVKP